MGQMAINWPPIWDFFRSDSVHINKLFLFSIKILFRLQWGSNNDLLARLMLAVIARGGGAWFDPRGNLNRFSTFWLTKLKFNESV